MIISVIVAVSENNVIGKNNDIPWHLPTDLKYFKKVTTGHHIIMGRKTYESIGRPLPNRTNIVVSRNKDLKIEGVTVVQSVDAALALAQMNGEDEAFIIGGESIYKSLLPEAERLYLTRVFTQIEGGTAFFPQYNEKMWIETNKYPYLPDDEHAYSYTMFVYERRM